MADVYHETVYFSGRVQGVGFRFTTLQVAKEFEVAGFVSNLPDGRVRLEAGLPLWGSDIDESTTPFEAGLDFAVVSGRTFRGSAALGSRSENAPASAL